MKKKKAIKGKRTLIREGRGGGGHLQPELSTIRKEGGEGDSEGGGWQGKEGGGTRIKKKRPN